MVASFLQGQMESQSLKLLSEGAKPEQRPDGLRLTLSGKNQGKLCLFYPTGSHSTGVA